MAEPKQYPFVSNRDIVVTSLQGYSIRFDKGVPTHVPKVMHAEVMEKGILPCDDGGATLSIDKVEDPKPKPKVLLAPEDPAERAEAIRVVIEALAERNSPKDFSAGGVPTSKAVTAALGWSADAQEIRPVWDAFKQAKAKG